MDQTMLRRFKSKRTVRSKYIPKLPQASERAYVRLTNQYMKILRDELEQHMPEIKDAYRKELEKDDFDGLHKDSMNDLMVAVSTIFDLMTTAIEKAVYAFGLEKKLESLANLSRKLTVGEWKKAIKATIGVDITEDYYLGDFYQGQMMEWVADNVDLIKTIPFDALDEMKQIILKGYMNGTNTTDIARLITKKYGTEKRHAKFIARDQMAKLNGQIQRAQQLDAGVTEYVWVTSMDQRVRKSHKELNGRKFSWNDPPMNSDGRKCHPGQDYGCRCIGRPVFDMELLRLPVEDDKNGTFKLI